MATIQSPQEQRMVLHNVSWDAYERLLTDHENGSTPRFTYDRGELEIMSPLPLNEQLIWAIESLVEIAAEEISQDFENLRSATFRREDLQRGFEPDSCFYLQNEPRIRGKSRIDLRVDPPPDLIVELDITSPSLDKLPIYAEFRVPEIWRYDGERLGIWLLEGDRYAAVAESRALPGVTAEVASRPIEESKGQRHILRLRAVREWASGLGGPRSGAT